MPTNISQNITYFEAEPFLKNSHLITHLLVYKNEEVILFTDKALHIYSFQQMLRDEAGLVHIIEYENIFKAAKLEENKGKHRNTEVYHMDEITQIFNQVELPSSSLEQKLFGERIFEDPNNINSNILLKGEAFINRLIYLNSIRVKNVKISVHGDLLINFVNGQTYFLLRDNNIRYYKSFRTIDLNALIKHKIQHITFISGANNLLAFYSEKKFYVYDYLLNSLVSQINPNSRELVNEIFAFSLAEEEYFAKDIKGTQKLIVAFQHPHKLEFFQLFAKKKKLINLALFQVPQAFIEKVFVYEKKFAFYVSTAQKIFKIDLKNFNHSKEAFKLITKMSRSKSKSSQKSSQPVPNKSEILQSEIITQFQIHSPQEMLYINQNGDFIPKCKDTSKEYTNLIFQSLFGIFFTVTCKKQGNYKEGQLLIGLQKDIFEDMIRKSLIQLKGLKNHEYLNFDDLKMIAGNPKLKKETVSKLSKFINETFQKFSQLDIEKGFKMQEEESVVQVFGIQMTQKEFEILLINLGFVFDSKSGARQKQIEKRLFRHYCEVKNMKSNQQQIPKNLNERCMFTHMEIGNEDTILECKICDIYGVKKQKDDSNVWEDGLRNGIHRCYVCMNQMSIV